VSFVTGFASATSLITVIKLSLMASSYAAALAPRVGWQCGPSPLPGLNC
jgi:hypothetical protein